MSNNNNTIDIFTNKLPPEADPSLLMIQRLGMFADWKLPTDEELRFLAEGLRFDDIILGIPQDKSRSGWVAKYPMSRVMERIVACREAGLEPVVMPWASRHSKGAIDGMCEYLLTVTDDKTAVLLDAEESWYRGGMSKQAAAEHVAEWLAERTWGVSGIGNIQKAVEPVARLAKFNVPQCYSFWKPGGEHWSHSRATFPGPQQDTGFEKWQEVNPDAELIMGIGCYWATRPAQGKTPELSTLHTMRFSAIETAALGVLSAWYWSLKWAKEEGERGNDVRQFFGYGF